MKCVIACVLILAGGATGQNADVKELQDELVSQLMRLRHTDREPGRTEDLTSSIIALAEASHEPSS